MTEFNVDDPKRNSMSFKKGNNISLTGQGPVELGDVSINKKLQSNHELILAPGSYTESPVFLDITLSSKLQQMKMPNYVSLHTLLALLSCK
jgi:hypothetical protein